MSKSPVVKIAWAGAVAFFVGTGAWAFLSPSSFFDKLATFEPFNAHFIRDLGVFTLGMGAALLAALRWRDGLLVVLVGASAAAVLHVLSHIIDSDLGGKATDVPLLSVFALLLLAGSVARAQELKP